MPPVATKPNKVKNLKFLHFDAAPPPSSRACDVNVM